MSSQAGSVHMGRDHSPDLGCSPNCTEGQEKIKFKQIKDVRNNHRDTKDYFNFTVGLSHTLCTMMVPI